jgi:hypothetical protein
MIPRQSSFCTTKRGRARPSQSGGHMLFDKVLSLGIPAVIAAASFLHVWAVGGLVTSGGVGGVARAFAASGSAPLLELEPTPLARRIAQRRGAPELSTNPAGTDAPIDPVGAGGRTAVHGLVRGSS